MRAPHLLTLVLLLLIVPAERAQAPAPAFRAGVDLVTLGASVSDRSGRPVTGFAPDDFEVVEDGRRQAIRFVVAGDASSADAPAVPLHLGLMLDTSESMGEDLKFSQSAAVKFLNTLTEAEDVTFVDFDAEVRVTRYAQRDFARLIERIRLKHAAGMTALYDAIGVYLDGAASQEGRKVMLLYTDGGDTTSAMGIGDLIDLLKASDVTVYAIGQLDHQPSSTRMEQRAVLQRIAETTGGLAFFPGPVRELDRVYERIAAEIRGQYTIGYTSTNDRADGTWRRVEVRVVRRDAREYRVRARRGYFAPLRKP